MNEGGDYHNEFNGSLLLELGILDDFKNKEERTFIDEVKEDKKDKEIDMSINYSVEEINELQEMMSPDKGENEGRRESFETGKREFKEQSTLEHSMLFSNSRVNHSQIQDEENLEKGMGSNAWNVGSNSTNLSFNCKLENSPKKTLLEKKSQFSGLSILPNLNNLINYNKMPENPEKFLESFSYDFVDSQLNRENNYQGYVSRVLKSTKGFKDLDFSNEIEKRKMVLPNLSPNQKHTILLDLDETLIHSEFDISSLNMDPAIASSTPNPILADSMDLSFYDKDIEEEVHFRVYLRPGVREFLALISQYFQVGIFTASIKEYADAVLKALDPDDKIFSFKCYRDSCIKVGRAYVKDLGIFQNRKLENLVILDNNLSPSAISYRTEFLFILSMIAPMIVN
eukprot:CAMPEP_0170520164 /NCGR_PEP_ID=MMETSP0209-20121228/5407_1 /TAXON_ID=665100 ORGANISM="Litonotus pictus, Strain P1" /NCGR_SAMPLE_ID=MMETSP0209 /ASSEMBLY_ACC=CAM_ASM_000301 /LENGTH=397 /DNA_ID=CAMNT_0010806309 /DNA_START=53 /DNA_END=1247 /DNA_ORIENTATION=-